MLPDPPQLDPATSPDALHIPYTLGAWEWVAIAGILIIIGIAAWLILKKKKAPVIPPTPEQIARGEIHRLMENNPGLKETSTGLSLILRSYFTGKSEDPALFETHQEFNRRADALAALPEPLQSPARDLLQRMAHLKYSSETPQDQQLVNALHQQTLNLIDQIEQASARRNEPQQNAAPQKISFQSQTPSPPTPR